jgi:hypothetical protein
MKNRYGDNYSFEEVGPDTYRIVGDLRYWRFGFKEGSSTNSLDDLAFADPSGGPFISIGYKINGYPVTRIFANGDEILFRVDKNSEEHNEKH